MQLFENLSEEENTDAEVRKMTNNLFLFNTFRLISLARWQEGSQWQMVLEIVAWAQFRNITSKIGVVVCYQINSDSLKNLNTSHFLCKTLSPASFFTSNHQRTRAGGVQEPVLGQVWPFSPLTQPSYLFIHFLVVMGFGFVYIVLFYFSASRQHKNDPFFKYRMWIW